MATKLYDLAVKTGEYQDRQSGQMKGRWQNVGVVMKGDDGTPFVMLNAWFNPAGVPRKDGSESVLISCFKPDDQRQPAGGGQPAPRQAAAPRPAAPAPTYAPADDSDIPFN
jgi:hypothetical protein